MKAMKAGNLRHVIDVDREIETVDPATGYRTKEWVPLIENEPAQWLPGPGREYLASEALRSEVQGRFIVRWSPATADIQFYDRVRWDGNVYDLKSDPLVDETGRREITLMVSKGLNDG